MVAEQSIEIILILRLNQHRQLPLCVPSLLTFISMVVVNIYFDVASVCAAG